MVLLEADDDVADDVLARKKKTFFFSFFFFFWVFFCTQRRRPSDSVTVISKTNIVWRVVGFVVFQPSFFFCFFFFLDLNIDILQTWCTNSQSNGLFRILKILYILCVIDLPVSTP